jgi:hypothetical protein
MSDDLPGMWEEADLVGGETDREVREPSPDDDTAPECWTEAPDHVLPATIYGEPKLLHFCANGPDCVPAVRLAEVTAQRDEALATVARIEALFDPDGYTTWDQKVRLGEPPWTTEACAEWERHHGHDPRTKCYPEYGCQLLIDPDDLSAVLAVPEEPT